MRMGLIEMFDDAKDFQSAFLGVNEGKLDRQIAPFLIGAAGVRVNHVRSILALVFRRKSEVRPPAGLARHAD